MIIKSCDTCMFVTAPNGSTVCQTCAGGGFDNYPNWKSFLAKVADLPEPTHDQVKSPSHYQLLPGVEVIHVRKALLEKMGHMTPYQIDCWSRAWEYITRAPAKNGLEDLKKAQTYLEWLIKDMEEK
jgi:hypothetical protein